MNLKIEDGIPIPDVPCPFVKDNRKKGYAELFRSLQVGQSVFVPGGTVKNLSQACSRAWDGGKDGVDRCRWKFTARTVEGGARIWRIA